MTRPLSPAERAVLDHLLAGEFPGAPRLRAQLPTARVTGTCACGCPTIDFVVDPALPAADLDGRVVVEADAPDGGIIVFAEEGRLSGLEYWSVRDDVPAEFPPPEQIQRAG
ncbi:hypothetical protein [Amycolatopsis sp. NPDC004378]